MVPRVTACSCDWSCLSLPVVTSITDPRALYTLGFIAALALLLAALLLRKRASAEGVRGRAAFRHHTGRHPRAQHLAPPCMC